jgi:hypothetical protein
MPNVAGRHPRIAGRTPRPQSTSPTLAEADGGTTSTDNEAHPTSPAQSSSRPLLLTAEQAAEILQVRPSWLRRKAACRAVPCRFLGKHLRFTADDLQKIADDAKA